MGKPAKHLVKAKIFVKSHHLVGPTCCQWEHSTYMGSRQMLRSSTKHQSTLGGPGNSALQQSLAELESKEAMWREVPQAEGYPMAGYIILMFS